MLERYRAALARGADPRRAARRRRRALPARARRVRGRARRRRRVLRRAAARDRPARRARRAAARRARARGACSSASSPRRGSSCWPAPRRRPGSCRRWRASSPSSSRGASRPARFAAALRAWAPAPRVAPAPLRRRAGGALRRLPGARSSDSGRLDAELAGVAALDALRLEPGALGRARRSSATASTTSSRCSSTRSRRSPTASASQVVLSLPGEPGRVALAGRAATLETLRPGAEEVVVLPPLDAHYEDAVLHHLERSLFEDAPARIAPGGAVRLLRGRRRARRGGAGRDRDRRARRGGLRAARHRGRDARAGARRRS